MPAVKSGSTQPLGQALQGAVSTLNRWVHHLCAKPKSKGGGWNFELQGVGTSIILGTVGRQGENKQNKDPPYPLSSCFTPFSFLFSKSPAFSSVHPFHHCPVACQDWFRLSHGFPWGSCICWGWQRESDSVPASNVAKCLARGNLEWAVGHHSLTLTACHQHGFS